MPVKDFSAQPINEKSSRRYRVLITGRSGPVNPTIVTHIYFTLVDVLTGNAINSREHQEIKGQNGGTLGTDGWLDLILGRDDTIAIGTGRFQKRRGLLEIEYDDGGVGAYENHVILLVIENLTEVT